MEFIAPGSDRAGLEFVYLAFRYQMKPATLSHNHTMCIHSVWPCSNSFTESINSHAWTCSHKYTTHCPARIGTNLSLLLSHTHTHTHSHCLFSPHRCFTASAPLALTLTYTQHTCVYKATAFSCFVSGQLGFGGQTQFLLSPRHTIHTSNTPRDHRRLEATQPPRPTCHRSSNTHRHTHKHI